jgi:hypothetical protein
MSLMICLSDSTPTSFARRNIAAVNHLKGQFDGGLMLVFQIQVTATKILAFRILKDEICDII